MSSTRTRSGPRLAAFDAAQNEYLRRARQRLHLDHQACGFRPRVPAQDSRIMPVRLAFQGLTYAEQGRFKEALSNMQKVALQERNPTILAFGAHVHAVAGNKREAEQLIQEVEEGAKHRYFCPYEIGTAYVSLGKPDTAFKWFRKGVEDRADCLAWLGVEPWIEPFRSDPRYVELLREVGLAPGTGAAR